MKANELRIGNLLKNDGVVVIADGVSILDIWSETGNYYEPIPLTPEWLERFGLKNTACRTYEHDNFYWEFIVQSADELVLIEEPDTGRVVAIIKYVHELQNLYFALTGEELTLNN